MARVRSGNTAPELFVRRLLTEMGYRYRLHRKDLPGTPDIAFIGRQRVIFVHGCFWHGHNCSRGARIPKANRDYWVAKIARNRARDVAVQDKFTDMGWKSLALYECQLKDKAALSERLTSFLS